MKKIDFATCHTFFYQFQWVTGDPVSFQMWLNKDFGHSYTSNFTELFNIPDFGQSYISNFTEVITFPSTTYRIEKKYSANNFSKIIFFTIYPEVSIKQKCVLMLLGNRAYPQWITVECKNIIQQISIVCMKYQPQATQIMKTNTANCPKNYMLKGKFCYDFVFFKGKTGTKHHRMITKKCLNLKSLQIFNFLFIAINVKLKPLLSVNCTNNTLIKQFSYEKYFSVITYKVKNVSVGDSEGYFVKRINYTTRNLKNIFGNVFLCSSGSFISSNKVCNGKMDCSITDNSDEDGCKCETLNKKCKYVTSEKRKTWQCSSLYFTGIDGKCYSFDHEYIHAEDRSIITNKIKCKNGNEIDTILVDDLVSDCGESADDEIILKHILVNHTYYPCYKEGEIPCKNGHNRCFDFSHVCVYRLNKYHHLVPCRTGGHLQECEKFECNLKYKCPGSYCKPLTYVCDGKWDCHTGYW